MAQEIELRSLNLAGIIRPGETVTWGQASAEPLPLAQALMAQRHSIGGLKVFLGATLSDTLKVEYADCIDFSGYSGTGGNRALARAGKLDIYPLHYSQLYRFLAHGRLKVDILMLQLAPADAHGHYSLSLAHEYLIPLLDSARVVIAEVNDQAPWTHGERVVLETDLDYIVYTSRPPLELRHPAAGEAELAIARQIAGMVEDGSTLQLGIGALPEAILAALSGHCDLGVHSGAIGDQVAVLMESGAINNAKKNIDPGVTIAGVIFGGRRIRQFCHRNTAVQFRATNYTHDNALLGRLDRFVSVNAAIEVDLSGQINAEVAGGSYIGAVGGAVDFQRAAQQSKGGLPFVATPSMAGKASRIVSRLSGPVSTPRSDAGIIVTEFGIADLRGMPLSKRMKKLIAVAHPDVRERLEREMHEKRLHGW